jgi:putative inorganic carbon (HCO3(-)) transporter
MLMNYQSPPIMRNRHHKQTPQQRPSQPAEQPSWLSQTGLLLGMALGLALCYRAGVLSPVYIRQISVAGLALFGLLAIVRLDMALLFVPLTAPLFGIPLVLPNGRGGTWLFQLHELALLAIVGAAAVRAAWWLVRERRVPRWQAHARMQTVWTYAPHALLLLTACASLLPAVDRGQALREIRWFIIEPLIFYALLRLTAAERWALRGLIVAGAVTACFALLQAAGSDLVPLVFGFKETGGFTENTVSDAGLARATSVYQHPNNLGLALERVWPLAAALAAGAWFLPPRRTVTSVRYALAALLCMGGIVVSFSRGAWLASGAAAVVLLLPLVWRRLGRRALPALAGMAVALALLAALALTVRGSVTGGSTSVRLLLWREAVQYIAMHPLGLGMGQFYFYHNPEFGRSLIDPALIGTSEQFVSHPHNLLLDIWLRLGPLGLLAFGWLLARFFRQARAALATMRGTIQWFVALGAAAAMIAALLHGMVDNFYFVADLAIDFWLLLALVESATATKKE